MITVTSFAISLPIPEEPPVMIAYGAEGPEATAGKGYTFSGDKRERKKRYTFTLMAIDRVSVRRHGDSPDCISTEG